MEDDSLEVMVGDFVQLTPDGTYYPVQRVLWEGVEVIIVDDNLAVRFAPYEAIYSVVPNDEYRAMLGNEPLR
jgi:hypothetical protein